MSIKFEKVNYTYDIGLPSEKVALRDISHIFSDHCFTALIGKTGSGKSTLLQHLNALILPTSGKISIGSYIIDFSLEYKDGKVDERKMKRKRKKKLKDIKSLRKKVGIVFQFPEYQLFEETVLKDVMFGPKNFGKSDEEAKKVSYEALKQVDLDSSYYERSPFELSGGEKRRVAIAGILALEPDVLVLDEPTVGLDADGEKNFLNLIKDIYSKGTSIILSTHNMDLVLKYAENALLLEDGKIVLADRPHVLFKNEELLKRSVLRKPKVLEFADELIKKGLPLNVENIFDIPSLAKEIDRCKR